MKNTHTEQTVYNISVQHHTQWRLLNFAYDAYAQVFTSSVIEFALLLYHCAVHICRAGIFVQTIVAIR